MSVPSSPKVGIIFLMCCLEPKQQESGWLVYFKRKRCWFCTLTFILRLWGVQNSQIQFQKVFCGSSWVRISRSFEKEKNVEVQKWLYQTSEEECRALKRANGLSRDVQRLIRWLRSGVSVSEWGITPLTVHTSWFNDSSLFKSAAGWMGSYQPSACPFSANNVKDLDLGSRSFLNPCLKLAA